MPELDSRRLSHSNLMLLRGRLASQRDRLRELRLLARQLTEQVRLLREEARRHAPPGRGPGERA